MSDDEKLRECWSCGLTQPPDYRFSLHLEDCPEHDDETCVTCLEEQAEKAGER